MMPHSEWEIQIKRFILDYMNQYLSVDSLLTEESIRHLKYIVLPLSLQRTLIGPVMPRLSENPDSKFKHLFKFLFEPWGSVCVGGG